MNAFFSVEGKNNLICTSKITLKCYCLSKNEVHDRYYFALIHKETLIGEKSRTKNIQNFVKDIILTTLHLELKFLYGFPIPNHCFIHYLNRET
ncbi:hypothetical protein T11_79 [Trichinella zimbabwensis]|uniref:Uncharacterized protein n=1 Tax=Trichinella zimbabwensis TaxID=268475 RepID=A0A0V1IA27_9BILA|nr:hypothetical protein T11_79 [Trichinella zimbabwensis]